MKKHIILSFLAFALIANILQLYATRAPLIILNRENPVDRSHPAAQEVTTVYFDQPTITATAVGQEFTVTTHVKNVVDLYAWQFGMTWNPSLLECTGVTVNYSFLGPAGQTIKTGGQINNTGGYMDALAVTLITTPPSGITGDGPLAHATFRTKATGTTNIHLAEVKLKDPATIPTNMIDVYTVDWDGELYPIVTVNNLTGLRQLYRFSNHAFNHTAREFSLNVTGPDDTFIFCNVTIPKSLLDGGTQPWEVKVDGTDIPFTKVENTTHTSLYFTLTLSTHKIQIIKTPPPPPTYGPTANFTYKPSTPIMNETVTLNASASLPGFNGTAEVPIANYTWDFDDGNVTTVTDPVIYHVFTAVGDYNVNLTITCEDDPVLIAKGITSNSTLKIITILPPIHGPTADFTYSPPSPLANQTITFDATGSLPGWNGTHEKPIVSYAWNFGDGSPTVVETDPVTTHKYTSDGDYTVTLNVTDSQDLWNTTTKTIKVLGAATVYFDQPTITATAVGQEFNVTVYIRNVADLYAWQLGMTWNSTMLNCTAFTPDFKWFGPEGSTLLVPGVINNTAGEIYPPYSCTLTPGPPGINGSGPLAIVTFKAKVTGTTDIHLAEVKLENSATETIPANIIDVYTTLLDATPYAIVMVSNLTGLTFRYRFSNHAFNHTAREFSLNVTGPDDAFIFCHVAIPKSLLDGGTQPWEVKVDGTDIPFTKVENTTHTSLYFTLTLSTHKIQIIKPLPPAYGPTANFTFSPLAPFMFETITFNASVSLPGWNGTHETPIVSYAWDFGDGTPIVTETDPIIIHEYTSDGDYTVTLNVTDSQGFWNTTTKMITVLGDTVEPFIGAPTHEPIEPDEWVNVTVSVSVTDGESGVKNVTLSYTINNGTSWTDLPMDYNSTTGLYEVTIPGQPYCTWVKYKIIAYDKAGNQAINDNTGQYYVYHVIPEFPTWAPMLLMLFAIVIAMTALKRRMRSHKMLKFYGTDNITS